MAFLVSSAFPAVASLSKDTRSFPRWRGVLDVGIAFVLALLALIVLVLARREADKHAEDSPPPADTPAAAPQARPLQKNGHGRKPLPASLPRRRVLPAFASDFREDWR